MRLALLALVVAAACGSAATGAPGIGAISSPTHHAATSPSPSINVDDMMGGSLSPATVLAHVGDELVAVKLQNHFIPYRVPVGGRPHVAMAVDGSRVYVADRKDGRTRIRALDPATGVEMTAANVLDEPPAGTRALAQDRPDRLLLLVEACPTCAWGAGVRVEAISTSPLAAQGALSKAECGDRLLASESRIAIVCSSSGTVQLDSLAGQVTRVSVPAPIVASAMLGDGTVIVGTADGTVGRIPSGTTALVSGPDAGQGAIVTDGIAAVAGMGFPKAERFVVVTTANGEAKATAYTAAGASIGGPFALRMPATNVVALWPYAYFGSVHGVYHVDLQSGRLERMVELDRPIPLAVAAR